MGCSRYGYDNITFRADKYLSSFRLVDSNKARARIDRLASQTRNDVQKLQTFISAKEDYVEVNSKYFRP